MTLILGKTFKMSPCITEVFANKKKKTSYEGHLTKKEDLIIPIIFIVFIHLLICVYIVWTISPISPPHFPSLPGRTCSALFSNFVEEKYKQ
jgi:hypothetical protein